MSAIYSFLKCLRYRQTQASSGNVENAQRQFGLPQRDPFLWPFTTITWLSTHALWTTVKDERTNRCVRLQRQLFLYFLAEPWR